MFSERVKILEAALLVEQSRFQSIQDMISRDSTDYPEDVIWAIYKIAKKGNQDVEDLKAGEIPDEIRDQVINSGGATSEDNETTDHSKE